MIGLIIVNGIDIIAVVYNNKVSRMCRRKKVRNCRYLQQLMMAGTI